MHLVVSFLREYAKMYDSVKMRSESTLWLLWSICFLTHILLHVSLVGLSASVFVRLATSSSSLYLESATAIQWYYLLENLSFILFLLYITVSELFHFILIFKQVCHRDLKLENTLLDGSPAPRLKICDFGYSKVLT